MERSTTRSTRAAILATFAILAVTPVDARAQGDGYLSFGNSTYDGDEDELCVESGASISEIEAGYEEDWWGLEGGYNNSDWPWPRPPGTGNDNANSVVAAFLTASSAQSQQTNYLTHGNAFHAMFRVLPLGFLGRFAGMEQLSSFNQYVRPYVGVGVQYSTDGETSPAGGDRELPTFAVLGSTNLIVTYGATLILPTRVGGVGLMIGYRGTRLFASELEIEDDAGEVQTVETDNLSWGSWSVGFRFRLGS